MNERIARIWFSCFCCASENFRLMPASFAAPFTDTVFAVRHALSAPTCEAERDGFLLRVRAAGQHRRRGNDRAGRQLPDECHGSSPMMSLSAVALFCFCVAQARVGAVRRPGRRAGPVCMPRISLETSPITF